MLSVTFILSLTELILRQLGSAWANNNIPVTVSFLPTCFFPGLLDRAHVLLLLSFFK
jgi:hypothetical protein